MLGIFFTLFCSFLKQHYELKKREIHTQTSRQMWQIEYQTLEAKSGWQCHLEQKESLLKWNSKKSPRKVTLMQVPFSLKIGLNYKLDREALYLFSVIETKWKNTRNLTNSRDWGKGYNTTRTVVLFGPSHLPALKNFISLLYYWQLHLSSL